MKPVTGSLERDKSESSFIANKDDPSSFYLAYSGIIEQGDVRNCFRFDADDIIASRIELRDD